MKRFAGRAAPAILGLLIASAAAEDKSKPARPATPAPRLDAEDREILENRELLEHLEMLQNFEKIKYLHLLAPSRRGQERSAATAPAEPASDREKGTGTRAGSDARRARATER